MALLGLHCRARASHCAGFSCCRAQALGVWASGVVTLGLSWPTAHGIFWGLGIEPMSSVLAGRFLTTGPPETFQAPVWTFTPGLILPHLTFPTLCSAHLCEMTGFQLELGHLSPGQQVDFCSGGQSSYCARLKDNYGTVLRQYAWPPDKPPISASSMEPGLPSAAMPCPHPLTAGHNPSPLLARGSLL